MCLHADYLEAVADSIGLTRPGVSILELGSGVGFVAMCLAANLPEASSITATEQVAVGAMEWLLCNISKNSHLSLSRLHARVCDWSAFAPEDGSNQGKQGRESVAEQQQENWNQRGHTGGFRERQAPLGGQLTGRKAAGAGVSQSVPPAGH